LHEPKNNNNKKHNKNSYRHQTFFLTSLSQVKMKTQIQQNGVFNLAVLTPADIG
jgi:hypothetical protein